MKSSKTLTSAVVAATLAGAIGLAYAQTQMPQSQMPSQPADSSVPMANQPATGTMSTPSTDTSMQTERPTQADRN